MKVKCDHANKNTCDGCFHAEEHDRKVDCIKAECPECRSNKSITVECVVIKPKKPRSAQIAKAAEQGALERALLTQIRMYGLHEGVAQYRAVPGRDYAWDRSWPELRLLVEVQGGIFSSKVKDPDKKNVMGHNSISGILRDHKKHNIATLQGWFVLYANTKTINDGSFIQTLAQYINKRM